MAVMTMVTMGDNSGSGDSGDTCGSDDRIRLFLGCRSAHGFYRASKFGKWLSIKHSEVADVGGVQLFEI